MARWGRGETEIEQLMAAGHLESVTGAQADGAPLLEQARNSRRGFRPFGALRRRRNELEYPLLPSDTATADEASQAAVAGWGSA
jgi:hypothetical protein